MASTLAATTTSSRLYYPFRALGAVTGGLPFVLNRRGDECFLTVSIDRAFQARHFVVHSTAEQERAFKPACFGSSRSAEGYPGSCLRATGVIKCRAVPLWTAATADSQVSIDVSTMT